MAPGTPVRLFEKFRRGEQPDQERIKPEGSGLGLYYVRTVADKHGGQAGGRRRRRREDPVLVELPLAATGADG